MHFNSLIIQFRLQLIGGAGALGTVAAYLIGSKVEDARERRLLRTFAPLALLILIVPAAVLDLFYYNRLLRGAVVAILELERNHPEINMSTRIDESAGLGRYVAWFAYGWMAAALLGFSLWSWRATETEAAISPVGACGTAKAVPFHKPRADKASATILRQRHDLQERRQHLNIGR